MRGLLAIAGVASVVLAMKLPAQTMRRELVLGGPSAIGVLVPISERWSFRADGTVGGTVNGVGGSSPIGPSSSWNFTVGASMLRHVPGDGPVRTYLLGRVGYQRSMPKGGTVGHVYTYSAGLGVSGRISDRFALFSEFTVQASYATSSSGGMQPYVTSWSSVNRLGVTVRRAERAP